MSDHTDESGLAIGCCAFAVALACLMVALGMVGLAGKFLFWAWRWW